MAAQRSEGNKRQRKRKQFYEEMADIGVTVQVQYYLSTAVRDFQKFRIYRYLPKEALSEPQNSMSGRQRLELDEALKEKMIWAFNNRENSFWRGKVTLISKKDEEKKGKEAKVKKRSTPKEQRKLSLQEEFDRRMREERDRGFDECVPHPTTPASNNSSQTTTAAKKTTPVASSTPGAKPSTPAATTFQKTKNNTSTACNTICGVQGFRSGCAVGSTVPPSIQKWRCCWIKRSSFLESMQRLSLSIIHFVIL